MKYLIIVLVVGVLFFVFRNRIKKWIERKQTKKIPVKSIDPELVYVPILGSRTFDFTLEIIEIGGGKATINVLKQKKEKIIDI